MFSNVEGSLEGEMYNGSIVLEIEEFDWDIDFKMNNGKIKIKMEKELSNV